MAAAMAVWAIWRLRMPSKEEADTNRSTRAWVRNATAIRIMTLRNPSTMINATPRRRSCPSNGLAFMLRFSVRYLR